MGFARCLFLCIQVLPMGVQKQTSYIPCYFPPPFVTIPCENAQKSPWLWGLGGGGGGGGGGGSTAPKKSPGSEISRLTDVRKLCKSHFCDVLVVFGNSHFSRPGGREQFPRTPWGPGAYKGNTKQTLGWPQACQNSEGPTVRAKRPKPQTVCFVGKIELLATQGTQRCDGQHSPRCRNQKTTGNSYGFHKVVKSCVKWGPEPWGCVCQKSSKCQTALFVATRGSN